MTSKRSLEERVSFIEEYLFGPGGPGLSTRPEGLRAEPVDTQLDNIILAIDRLVPKVPHRWVGMAEFRSDFVLLDDREYRRMVEARRIVDRLMIGIQEDLDGGEEPTTAD